MQNINEIEELIKLISKLPGLGPKSAKRIVLKLINNINTENVIVKEPLTKKDLINEYAKANIGIVSLKNKNIFRNAIPSKTFEYMSCGLAVICTIKGEIENIIMESKGGVCIEPGDPVIFANTVKIRKFKFNE